MRSVFVCCVCLFVGVALCLDRCIIFGNTMPYQDAYFCTASILLFIDLASLLSCFVLV